MAHAARPTGYPEQNGLTLFEIILLAHCGLFVVAVLSLGAWACGQLVS